MCGGRDLSVLQGAYENQFWEEEQEYRGEGLVGRNDCGVSVWGQG